MNVIEDCLTQLLGASAVVNGEDMRARYQSDWTRMYTGVASAVVRPASTGDVAKCVRWCHENGVVIVPQGGNTGLVGGAIPLGDAPQIVLSLERLNQVTRVDPVTNTMTIGAGVVLADAQAAAQAQNRLFPLSLGAEGSCQIGGCIATNAGGTAVLRYGNMRELVLGLEVVLPDGTVWSRLRELRKDNAGMDLKHLFIGSEGTLGIITAATVRIFPMPNATAVALVAVPSTDKVLDLFVRVRDAFDAELTAFEFISEACMALSCTHLQRSRPFPARSDYYVLLEVASPHEEAFVQEQLLNCLSAAMDDEVVNDAALASSQEQANTFWALREGVPEAMIRHYERRWMAFDIAVPIGLIDRFVREMETAIGARWGDVDTLLFGHVGDGNLHLNFAMQETDAAEVFQARKAEITQLVCELTTANAGSISAEHGVGQDKRDLLPRYLDEAHMALMGTVKAALDPRRILNPAKLLAATM